MSYNSPDIAAQLLINQIERSKDVFGDRFSDRTDEDYKIYAMCARGLMQSISLQAVSGTLTEPDLTAHKCIQLLLKMMDTPQEETKAVLEALAKLDIPEKVAGVLG